MKKLIFIVILFFNIMPFWREGSFTLLQTQKAAAQNANVILRDYLRLYGTPGHNYQTTTNGSQAQVIETDGDGHFVAFHNVSEYSNDSHFIAYQYNTYNGSNNSSQDTDDEYYYDDGSGEFTKITGEWIEATFDPMSVHWDWESTGFTQEAVIGPANCNDLLTGTREDYWNGESESEKANMVTGSPMPGLPCTNRFLIGNKILHFTMEQQAMIKQYNFDGSTLISVTDVNGNVYGNVVEHDDYTQRLVTMSNIAGCDGLEQKRTLLLSGKTTYKFVCFQKLNTDFSGLASSYNIERLTAITPGGNSKTVFKNIPANLDGYSFTVPATSLENAIAGSVVLGRTKTGAYYCETLMREDIERGAEQHRDTKYIPEEINFHLDHPVNLPRWVRNFLEIFPDLALGSCTINYVNTKLDELHQSAGYASETNEDNRKKMEYQSLGYDLLFGYLYCATDEASVQGANCAAQAGVGMLHELVAMADVAAMRDGIVKMVQGLGSIVGDNVKNMIDGVKEAVRQQVSTGIVNHDQLATAVVAKNISINNTAWNTVKKIADAFRKMYFTDCGQFNFPGGGQGNICCYRNGQLAMMVLPLVLTVGDYAVMKLSGLAAKYGQRAARAVEMLSDAERLGATMVDDAGKLLIKESDEADALIISTQERVADDVVITGEQDLKTVIDEGDLNNTPKPVAETPSEITTPPGDKASGWNKKLNNALEPNKRYKVGDFVYETDAQGRVAKATCADLKRDILRDRNNYQQSVKCKKIKDALPGDQDAHIFASRFNGPGEQINLLPMKSSLNQNPGGWYTMEQQWKTALGQTGGAVTDIEIQIIYGANKRPTKFLVKAKVNNEIKLYQHSNL